jgi:MFS family permease
MRHAQRDFAPAAALPARNRLTLPVLCVAVLVAQVDSSVANLATRPIGAYFTADVSALQWVIDSYNLVYAALLLTGGLLADLLGRRRVFMAGAALFAAASLLSALAPTIWVLILGRALAGFGAALLLPASLAIVRVAWPDPVERGQALGIWTGCNGLGLAIGPTLGGVLIENFGWRSVFLIVVPLAAAAIGLAPLAVAPNPPIPMGAISTGRRRARARWRSASSPLRRSNPITTLPLQQPLYSSRRPP